MQKQFVLHVLSGFYLGAEGANHTITILKRQLQQVMDQVCCEKVSDLPDYLIQDAV
ncbi:MAG: hypothetical protein ABIR03_01965 [Ginsengibacter sp.]